jgi:CheY-like chemotaxis protein
LTRRILIRFGYQVAAAADGGEALDLWRKHEGQIELALLDLTMPVLGGAAVYREIRARSPQLPVILTSGFDESDALASFGEQERPLFLGKPYPVADLMELVRRTLADRPVLGEFSANE